MHRIDLAILTRLGVMSTLLLSAGIACTQHKTSTPKEFFESMKGAFERKDAKALWAAYSKASREMILGEVREAQANFKDHPEAARELKEKMKLKQNPAEMETEELAIAMIRSGMEQEGPKEFKLVEVREKGEKAALSVEYVNNQGVQKRKERLVKEDGQWHIDAIDEAKQGKCKHLLMSLKEACKMYEMDWNAYPPSGIMNMVKALQTLDPKKHPFFEFTKEMLNAKGEIVDPWGQPLVYKNNQVNWPGNQSDPKAHSKQHFDIWSLGPDGDDNDGMFWEINTWD